MIKPILKAQNSLYNCARQIENVTVNLVIVKTIYTILLVNVIYVSRSNETANSKNYMNKARVILLMLLFDMLCNNLLFVI